MHHRTTLNQGPALFLIKTSARWRIGAMRRPDGFLRARRCERNGKRKQRSGRRTFDDTHAASKSPIGGIDRWRRTMTSTAALVCGWSLESSGQTRFTLFRVKI
jgi:hypothetical protein